MRAVFFARLKERQTKGGKSYRRLTKKKKNGEKTKRTACRASVSSHEILRTCKALSIPPLPHKQPPKKLTVNRFFFSFPTRHPIHRPWLETQLRCPGKALFAINPPITCPMFLWRQPMFLWRQPILYQLYFEKQLLLPNWGLDQTGTSCRSTAADKTGKDEAIKDCPSEQAALADILRTRGQQLPSVNYPDTVSTAARGLSLSRPNKDRRSVLLAPTQSLWCPTSALS